jgi:hypothetical protein
MARLRWLHFVGGMGVPPVQVQARAKPSWPKNRLPQKMKAYAGAGFKRGCSQKTFNIPVILSGAQLRGESRQPEKERFFAALRMTNTGLLSRLQKCRFH